MRKSREKSALLALLLQILYLFFCHTVGCPRDLGLIKEKDMTMKDRFFKKKLRVHGLGCMTGMSLWKMARELLGERVSEEGLTYLSDDTQQHDGESLCQRTLKGLCNLGPYNSKTLSKCCWVRFHGSIHRQS